MCGSPIVCLVLLEGEVKGVVVLWLTKKNMRRVKYREGFFPSFSLLRTFILGSTDFDLPCEAHFLKMFYS